MSINYCFSLPDIHCVACVPNAQSAVDESLAEIRIRATTSIDVLKKQLTIIIEDPTQFDEVNFLTTLQRTMDEHGLTCELKNKNTARMSNAYWHLLQSMIGIIAGFGLLSLPWFFMTLPLFAMVAIASFSILLTLGLGYRSYYEAAKKIWLRQALSMDSLYALSSLLIIVISLAALWVPGLPFMLDAGLFIFGFHHLGIFIQEQAKLATRVNVRFQDRLPLVVTQWFENGATSSKALNQIAKDEWIIVMPGEIIPVDGVARDEGIIITDEIISGKTRSRPTQLQERLYSGMRVKLGSQPLIMQVTQSAVNSNLARLDRSIERANHDEKKAPIELTTGRIIPYFIGSVLSVAVVSSIIVGFLFTPLLGVQCAALLLVSACPCTLGLITPFAIRIGMKKSSEYGVQFKSAEALQSADEIDRIVFDLNGTLTFGKPKISACTIPSQWFSSIAALEKDSKHMIARSILDYMGIQDVYSIDSIQDERGGVSSKDYLMGNEVMMTRHGINMPPLALKDDQRVIYFAHQGKLIGHFILEDRLRDDAFSVLKELKARGKTIYMCTGSDEATAQRYASQLGLSMEQVRFNCSPQQKADFVVQLQQKNALGQSTHRVSFCGDRGNDALPMAVSDFSLAIGDYDEVTECEARAVTTSELLQPVLNAHEIAERTMLNIKQGLLITTIYNFGAILLPFVSLLSGGFMLSPAVGVGLMVFQASVVFLNAYRFYCEPVMTQDTPPRTSYAMMRRNFPEGNQLDERIENELDYSASSVRLFKSDNRSTLTTSSEGPDSLDTMLGYTK